MQIREPHFLLPEYHASTRTVFGTSGIVHTACFLMLAALFWLSPGHRIDSPVERGAPIDLVYVPQPGAIACSRSAAG